MPVYEVTAPNGRTYEITAPEGATIDDAIAYAQQQYGEPAANKNKGQERSFARTIADLGVSFLQGGVDVNRAVAAVGGADNVVAETLGDASKGLDKHLRSDFARERRERHNRAMDEASNKGMLAEAGQAVENFADAPFDYAAQGIGSVAGLWPALKTAGLTAARAGLGALGAKALQFGAVGAPTGVGATKLSQYEEVYDYLRGQGVPEEQARAKAAEAQSYGKDNAAQHAIGAALGGIDVVTGGEAAMMGGKKRLLDTLRARGVNALRRGGEEFGTEFVQAGHEKFAGNVAAIDAGDTGRDPLRGVVGAATQEGLMGGGPGAIMGMAESGRPSTSKTTEAGDIQAEQPIAGETLDTPESPAPFSDEEKSGITQFAQARLAEIEKKAKGTPDQTVTGPYGTPVTIPGEQPQYLTPTEKAERDFLAQNAGDPGAVAKAYGIQPTPKAKPATIEAINQELIDLVEAEQADLDARMAKLPRLSDGTVVVEGRPLSSIPSSQIEQRHAEASTPEARQSIANEMQRRGIEIPQLPPIASAKPAAPPSEQGEGQIAAPLQGAPGAVVRPSQQPVAGAAPDIPGIVRALQNRNRDSAASAAQMAKIASDPNPRLLMAAPTMQDGAPVVADLHGVGGMILGNADAVVTGKREIPIRYAVVEAESLSASNFADGSRNPDYATPGKVVAINNGRTAGVVEAYRRGTAAKYRATIENAAATHGIPSATIKAMKAPVLVRAMSPADITQDIGDESNAGMTLGMSATEQARNDATRFDATAVEYTEDGRPTDGSLRGFIAAMPEGERQNLAPDGMPTKQAVDRLSAAVFHAAYDDAELVGLIAQTTDEEAKSVLSAMSRAAASMAKLKDAGDLDIRSIVTGAARKIVNAARSGVSMSKFLAQGDLLDGSAERRVAEMFARNARSAKRIAERLVYWADFAYAESRRGGIDIFGEKIPTASREDIIKGLTDDTAGQEDLGQQGRWRPGNGNDGREANDRGRPQDAGVAQANQQHRQYRSAQELLSSYSAADLSERQARIEAAEKEQAKLQAELAKQERSRLDHVDIKRRSELAADLFELGQDAADNLSGQGALFQRFRKYANPSQLSLILDQLPTRPSEDTAASRADRLGLASGIGLRGANGSLLGLAISADWIKGKGADLIGQRVTSHKDLATLAAVLRDPRAETFRYFLVKNGEIVYHTAVTSRMTSSSAAFVGSAGDFMNQIKATMERIGADGYYLLHNHPSGITQASEADVKLTRNVSAAIPGFLGHVILDHTEYGLIDTENPTGEAGRSFQSFKGSFPLDVTGPDPTRTGGTIPHPALGTSISSPSLFAEMANGLRDASNVVMVATDAQLRVTGIMEVPAEHMKRGKLTAFKHMARLRKVAGADYLFAITPDGMDHGDLSGNILNSGWLLDVHVSASPTSAVRGSLQDRGQMAGHRGLGRYREMFAAQPQLAYQLGLFGVMDDARREETAIAERKDSPQITLFAALDAAKIGAGETAGDPIGWDAMDIPMREELAVSAGWKTKKGSINPQGKQIVRRSWADMPQGTRDTLTRFANGDEKVGAGGTATTEKSSDVEPQTEGKIEDFGEKLGGARKDQAAALRDAVTREMSDEEIASQPLSKIWPKESIDQIEDPFIAAVAHAARAEVPAKPRQPYKLKGWVTIVKTMRGLTGYMLRGSVSKEMFAAKLKEGSRGLEHFAAKVSLLESIDRANWDRIGRVEEYPQAYKYGEDGKTQIPSPIVRVEIDGLSQRYEASSVADVLDKVRDALGEAPKAKRMEFEVRGQPGRYAINKKGDKLYRKLKTFETTKEAFEFRDKHYDELVAAWEAVKDSDNVKETDVRRAENRPRTAQDWRKGKDVTPEEFQDAFSFRGIEFGNWVAQGKSGKERQGMLNQSYDALMDLASIIGVPPKAMSLNGTLGLGFGSRGSGKFAAHFEPDMLVINLTKTRGAGSLAHEWFHALDNYFQSQRGKGYDYITNNPENYYVHTGQNNSQKIPAREFERAVTHNPQRFIKKGVGLSNAEVIRLLKGNPVEFAKVSDWQFKEGVRTEVAEAFADLVKALNESPMAKRASLIDKGRSGGYWSRIIERGARSFENYIIHKMMLKGYHNDYLANVTSIEDFARDHGRYPYLLEGEIQPVAEAFDNLFATIQTKETDSGVAMFSRAEFRAKEVRDDKGRLLAPNGKPSKLYERQWHQVRSPEFKAWFGDWEKHAKADNPVGSLWSDESVSKVVDENGEPLVVYHGTKKGGFAAFDTYKRDKHRSEMMFAAATRRTAMSYSGSESEIDLSVEADNWKVARNAGGMFEIVDANGNAIDHISDTSYATESAAQNELQAIRDEQEENYDEQRGIYHVFLNIRNPIEEDMRGGNWDGSNDGMFNLIGPDGGFWYAEDGNDTFTEGMAQNIAEQNGWEEGEYEIQPADTGQTTNDIAEGGKRYGNDGAIISNVVDDGGQGGWVDADDVFVFFDDYQAKSATQNFGAFSGDDRRLRFSSGIDSVGNSPYPLSKDQSAATRLNRGLVEHFKDPSWENAYVQRNLPDSFNAVAEAARAAFGTRVVGVTATERRFNQFNGINLYRTAYVNLGAKPSFVNIAGHEIYHSLEKDRPDLHQWLVEQARTFYRDFDGYQTKLNALVGQNEKPYTREAAESELMADFTGDALADPEFLAQLAKDDGSKFRRLLNAIVGWLKLAGEKLTGKDLGSSAYFTDVNELRKFLNRALLAYASNKPIDRILALDVPKFMTAWHGSPHDHDGLGSSSDRIGDPSEIESLPDGVIADAKLLADLVNAESFVKKGLRSLNIPSRLAQLGRVSRLVENDKVRQVVVQSIPVDVMDMLVSRQLTPDMLLHDPSVFRDLLSVDGDNPVSLHVDVASRLANVVAISAAKVAKLSPSDIASAPFKSDSAMVASKGNSLSPALNGAVNIGDSIGSLVSNAEARPANTASNIFHATPQSKDGDVIPNSERIVNSEIFDDSDVKITAKLSRGTGRGMSLRDLQAVDTESPEFKRWSGGASIKSEGFKTGDPVVIRGQHASTYGDITEFKTEEQRFGKAGYGFYFSDAAGANLFAEYGDKFQMPRSARGEEKAVKTYPVFIAMRNPLVVDHVDDLKPYLDAGQKFGVARGIFGNLSPDTITKLQKQGYDGVISSETTATKVHKTQGLKILDRNDPKATNFPVYVAFEPTQIKSAISNTGEFSDTNPDIRQSRGTGRGMSLRDLQAVVDRIAKGFKNLPRVHVLSSPADLSTQDPSQKALRDFIKKSGAWGDVEGATHDGEIYLFASGMADEARAEHVLATHEITHYGLRATMGKDLDAALQHVMLMNAKVRKAAEAVKRARGLKSNVEAVEEVLADMPSADLAKLRGWRKVVQVVRNWLNKAGAKNLAARLDAWMKAGLSEQEKADLFVADLVGAARQWVKSGKSVSSGIAGGTRLAEQRLSDDLAAQEKWLEREAKMRGFKSIDDLAEKDYPAFENLAALWRKKHPVDAALLSRRIDAGGIEIGEAKYGKHPEHDGIVERQVDDVIAGSRRVTVVPTKISAMFGVAGFGIYGRVYKLKDGRYLLEQNNGSHIDKKKAFWIIGDDLDAVLDRGEARLKNSDAAVGRARTSKISKPLRAELEEEFGKVFEYEISNASNSSSFYITHKPSGIKIRISDHDLPSYYENTADIDLRKEDAETGEALQESDVAHALRAEIARRNGAPTPSVDPDSIGSRSLGASRNEMQERPAVRADESGSLEEPAQSGGGAGSGANIPRLSRAVPPAPTSAVSPAPQTRIKQWKATANSAIERMDNAINGMGELPDQASYLAERYRTLGRIAQVDEIAGNIRDSFSAATPADKKAIYDYLTTRGATSAAIQNSGVRDQAEKTKKYIGTVGDQLVKRGLIPQESREEYRDRYLPRLYLAHLLDDSSWRAIGGGKKASDMGYLNERNDDLPEEYRKVILGEVTDPAFLAASAIAQPMRDMAILDWLGKIVGNENWVWPKQLIEWGGRKVSAHWLQAEADALLKRAALYESDTDQKKAEAVATEMRKKALAAMADMPREHADYKRIPDTPRYGQLRGLMVRREIYDDLVGLGSGVPGDAGFAEQLLGQGGIGSKATQLWKTAKVALNPPGQIRNFISNAVMLQLSGVPLRKIPGLIVRAAKQIKHGGKHWQAAKKYGVTAATFTAQELYRSKRDLLDLEVQMKGHHPLLAVKMAASWVMDKAGDAYQFSEALMKTAKMIDAMEREGMSDEQAALEAQKWLFDYSLVNRNIRYLRNAPVGMPFLTYSAKVAPRLAEVAAKHPLRFLPWVVLFYGMGAAAMVMLGGDGDDWDELKKSLPEWLRKKPHAVPLPWRDSEGRIQFTDIGYFFPWSQWAELGKDLAHGEPMDALRSAGIIGGPVPDIITAIKTGIDPFTKKPIADPADPTWQQSVAVMNYAWSMAAPPFLTSNGFLSPMGLFDKQYGGKLVQGVTGTTDKWGDPRATTEQAFIGLAGVNIKGVDPDHTRASELQRLNREALDVKAKLVRRLADRSLSETQRTILISDYTKEMQERAKKAHEFGNSAKVPAFSRPIGGADAR